MKNKLELTDFELNQSGVIKLITYFEDRLVGYRITNDSPDSDPLLRGNIAEIKLVLKKLKHSSPNSIMGVGFDNPKLRG